MKVQYFPETDMLSIVLAPTPYEAAGAEDTGDPDLVLHYDAANRIAEIEIEHASKRIDIDLLKKGVHYEEHIDPRAIREGAGLSQAEFAARLGISVRTLQNWEQGHRSPTGPALRLLRLAKRDPTLLLI